MPIEEDKHLHQHELKILDVKAQVELTGVVIF